MGLFDFVKNIGKNLFSKEAEAAESIKKHIAEENPGIDGLDVTFDNGIVNITGNAASPEAMEKAILMAGNVKGVENVTAEGLTAPEQTEKVEYYTIVSGDTLSGIAKKYLGNANDYPKIFEANREVIKDPDKIFVGQKIRIPMNA